MAPTPKECVRGCGAGVEREGEGETRVRFGEAGSGCMKSRVFLSDQFSILITVH